VNSGRAAAAALVDVLKVFQGLAIIAES